MGSPNKEYYFLDIDLSKMTVVEWGVSQTATHTGDTDTAEVHRMFLPKGQYNKLIAKLQNWKA